MTDQRYYADGTDAFTRPRSGLARLPFAWWNTRMAGLVGKSSADIQGHVDAVIEVVRMLVREEGCLLLGLAEVEGQNVLEWIPADLRGAWGVIEDTSKDRYPFDVTIMFDRTKIELMDHYWARGHHASHRVRAGLIATFGFVDTEDWLIVAAAHWRSDKVGGPDASDRRSTAALTLKQALVGRLDVVGAGAPVLIFGDFNAEPFDAPFGSSLPTARSRAEVQRHRPCNPSDLLFYNAAWRWLGERHPWGGSEPPPTLAGTYRWGSSNVPKTWRTFDQVLVSPSLLGTNSWSLDERVLGVLEDARVFDGSRSRPRAPFDHLPIVGHLQKSTQGTSGTTRQP